MNPEWTPIKITVWVEGAQDTYDLTAYEKNGELVIPVQENFGNLDQENEGFHNCDFLGCGFDHVAMRIKVKD